LFSCHKINPKIGFCKNYELLSYIRTGSAMRGFGEEGCALSLVSYGSGILGYVRVVMRGVNCSLD